MPQSPSLQAPPRRLLDRQHGVGRGEQFATAAFFFQGEDRPVVADGHRGPASFEADQFVGIVLGRAEILVFRALAASRIGQRQNLVGIQRPAVDSQIVDQAAMRGRSGPASHMKVAAVPDRVVPVG